MAVGPVLERVERMLNMVAAEKGVTISGQASEDAVALATDDDVHQVLYNLMENGIKYSAQENGFVGRRPGETEEWSSPSPTTASASRTRICPCF